MKTKSTTPAAQKSITYNPHERMRIFRDLIVPEQYAVFVELSPHIQQTILTKLKTIEIVDLLDHMDMQQAERALAKIRDAKKRGRIVQRLKGEVKEKMDYFLRFHPQASLSLITFNYIFVAETKTVAFVADMVDEHYEETGKYPEILVHRDGELVGEAPLSQMVRARNTMTLKKMIRPIGTIAYQSEVSEIVTALTDSVARKLVVIDHDTSVLGVIYADAARQLFGHLPAESLYDFAGVDDSERPFDSVGKKVNNRYKWLILNLATAFLASSVVLLYQDTLDALTILAIYMPVIAGMGGNAATQSFAIMVRGITLGTISLKNAAPALWAELAAGCINGIIIGAVVALISAVWNGEPLLGLVVAVALVGAHIVAAVAGSFIPLFMKHIGKDPAATSTIFISTITDVAGLFFLLGLATLILL
jgi:magnesium transporter